MIELSHDDWNIRYEAMTVDDARRMMQTALPEAVASAFNRLRRQLAETQFLLSCRETGNLAESLATEWPEANYHVVATESGVRTRVTDSILLGTGG